MAAIDEMRKRIEPATPAEVPSANWSFAASVTIVMAAPWGNKSVKGSKVWVLCAEGVVSCYCPTTSDNSNT